MILERVAFVAEQLAFSCDRDSLRGICSRAPSDSSYVTVDMSHCFTLALCEPMLDRLQGYIIADLFRMLLGVLRSFDICIRRLAFPRQ